MAYSREQLRNIFTYHPPTPDDQIAYEKVRNAAYEFAVALVECTPPSADQTTAIRKLRECVMTANAAIALKGQS